MSGLLFSQMEPPPGWEPEFHDWYDCAHVPARMAIPGFASATRYVALEGAPRYLACYFLENVQALGSPEYERLKGERGERTERMLADVRGFTRYICDEVSDTGSVDDDSDALFVVGFSVPDADREEFDGWYEDEHIPMLMQLPGWVRVRRYLIRPDSVGPPWTHVALHELRSTEALDRPERAAARDTPRRDALAARPWFGKSGRWVYRPIRRAVAAAAQQ